MKRKETVEMIFENGVTSQLFEKLVFVKPFEKGTVEFEGVRRKPGVLVVRYKNGTPFPRIRIGKALTCMYLGAHSSLKTISENGGKEISFSFNPVKKVEEKELENLKKNIWMSYLCKSLTNPEDFLRLDNLLKEETLNEFLDSLTYRPAYYFDEFGTIRSTFQDYADRTGWYVFKEEGKVVRVGQAIGTLPKRTLFYFSASTERKGNTYYNPRSGLMYELAFIELPLSLCASFSELKQKVDSFEDRMIKLIKPRDNQKGKPKEAHRETISLEEFVGLESLGEKLPF